MTERRTILDRVAKAYDSSDLSMESYQLGRIKDVDVLIATGIAARRSSISAAIMAANAGGSVAAIKKARESIIGLVRKLSERRNWGATDEDLVKVAELALVHHVSPACRHCHGRGYHVDPGSAKLSSRKCSHCKGTGRHPIQKRHRERVEVVLSTLANIDSMAEYYVRKLLR